MWFCVLGLWQHIEQVRHWTGVHKWGMSWQESIFGAGMILIKILWRAVCTLCLMLASLLRGRCHLTGDTFLSKLKEMCTIGQRVEERQWMQCASYWGIVPQCQTMRKSVYALYIPQSANIGSLSCRGNVSGVSVLLSWWLFTCYTLMVPEIVSQTYTHLLKMPSLKVDIVGSIRECLMPLTHRKVMA